MIERHLPTSSAQLIEVIYTVSYRGSNEPGDPARILYQYWDKDGRFLAEHDTLGEMLAEEASRK